MTRTASNLPRRTLNAIAVIGAAPMLLAIILAMAGAVLRGTIVPFILPILVVPWTTVCFFAVQVARLWYVWRLDPVERGAKQRFDDRQLECGRRMAVYADIVVFREIDSSWTMTTIVIPNADLLGASADLAARAWLPLPLPVRIAYEDDGERREMLWHSLRPVLVVEAIEDAMRRSKDAKPIGTSKSLASTEGVNPFRRTSATGGSP